jgi:endonuclease/exonuclease/phosphatase family metal-dependent hydrolase
MSRYLILVLYSLFMCAEAVSQTPIPISEARKQEFGTTVSRVAGRVTAGSVFRNIAYIQDQTAGIAVFNGAFNAAVRVGDSVVIDSAQLTEFGQSSGAPGTGLTELAGSNLRFTVIPVERVPPAPRTTTIPLIGECFEGQLVRLRRVTFLEKGAFQGETNYNVRDAQGNDIAVRIDGATEIATNSLPIPTEAVDLIGCVGQFRGGYQILPRFSTDISLPPIEKDTVNRNRTLDVTTLNLDWYGSSDTSRGPSDKQRQRRSIRQVMDSIGADLYALQEVTSESALNALSDSIAGSYASLYTNDIPSEQKMAYIYNMKTIKTISSSLAVNGGSQAWAGGRYPYRLTFDADVDGLGKRYVVFNIHGKATSDSTAQNDYERRKADAETFYTYLKDFYSDTSVIFTGDYNDMLTSSIVDSTYSSPYSVFVNDAQRWFSPTLPLEQSGLSSYVGFTRSFLDHFFLSSDLKPFHHRTYLEAPQAYLSSYSSTVSDHLPVTMRIFVGEYTSVDEETHKELSVRTAPLPMIDHGMAEVVIESEGRLTATLVNSLGMTWILVDEFITPQIRLVPIPVQSLSSGQYILHVSHNGNVASSKVIITR